MSADGFEWLLHSNPKPQVLKVDTLSSLPRDVLRDISSSHVRAGCEQADPQPGKATLLLPTPRKRSKGHPALLLQVFQSHALSHPHGQKRSVLIRASDRNTMTGGGPALLLKIAKDPPVDRNRNRAKVAAHLPEARKPEPFAQNPSAFSTSSRTCANRGKPPSVTPAVRGMNLQIPAR
jgi:hypothetical protein